MYTNSTPLHFVVSLLPCFTEHKKGDKAYKRSMPARANVYRDLRPILLQVGTIS
jgi:hypothetical protein